MSVYRTDYTILSSDVDPDRRLRLSRLFTLLQEMSIAHTIGKPIAFVCNGQEYDDIVKFNTEWMIDRMFSE
jgi:hypothetical protein